MMAYPFQIFVLIYKYVSVWRWRCSNNATVWLCVLQCKRKCANINKTKWIQPKYSVLCCHLIFRVIIITALLLCAHLNVYTCSNNNAQLRVVGSNINSLQISSAYAHTHTHMRALNPSIALSYLLWWLESQIPRTHLFDSNILCRTKEKKRENNVPSKLNANK